MHQDTKCKVPWCTGKVDRSGKGYCRRHYDQIRKYGSILNTRTNYDLNEIEICEDCAYIILANKVGEETGRVKIDKEDVEKVKNHRWTDNGNGYIRTFNGTTPIYLHRFLMGCSEEEEIDHKNRDRKDNRKQNLRIVEHYVNCHNRGKKSPYLIRGRNLSKPYVARLTVHGERIYLGYYEAEKDAEIRIKEECERRGLNVELN